MGTDALIDIDDDCWTILARYNLVLATVFALAVLLTRVMTPDATVLIAENGVLAVLFGAIQTYCWLASG